ncbi:MAG: ParB/RepB/Spo0J family partition protein [Thermoguttaceae bacterium]|nr:ParB/RepB/Spo0J family partition protein [Thermoguttaceae bacterium]
MSKDRRLGRGIDFLLRELPTAAPTATPTTVPTVPSTVRTPNSRSIASDAVPANPNSIDTSSSSGSFSLDSINYPDSANFTNSDSLSDTALLYRPMAATIPAEPTIPDRLPVGAIRSNPFQPRTDFDPIELEQLAQSLKDYGLLQPLVVRQNGDEWQLVAGERRLRAAQLAGWQEVPVRVVEADDRKLAELAIVENLQRKDLSALEKASSFERYMATYHCRMEELASRLGLDRSTVANLIRLLELPDSIKQAMRDGDLTAGHARAMLPLGNENEMLELLEKIRNEVLSVRAVEMIVQQMITKTDDLLAPEIEKPVKKKEKTPESILRHLAELEQQFHAALGTKVKLTQTAKGKGRLVISFASNEEFERVRELLCHGV